MSAQLSIHTVKAIRIVRQFFPSSEAGAFHVTDIVLTDENGFSHVVKCFHDDEPIAITGDVALPATEEATP